LLSWAEIDIRTMKIFLIWHESDDVCMDLVRFLWLFSNLYYVTYETLWRTLQLHQKSGVLSFENPKKLHTDNGGSVWNKLQNFLMCNYSSMDTWGPCNNNSVMLSAHQSWCIADMQRSEIRSEHHKVLKKSRLVMLAEASMALAPSFSWCGACVAAYIPVRGRNSGVRLSCRDPCTRYYAGPMDVRHMFL
jgi:hypothetical protein